MSTTSAIEKSKLDEKITALNKSSIKDLSFFDKPAWWIPITDGANSLKY